MELVKPKLFISASSSGGDGSSSSSVEASGAITELYVTQIIAGLLLLVADFLGAEVLSQVLC